MKEKNLSRKCFALGFLCLAFAFAACGDDGNDSNAVDDNNTDNDAENNVEQLSSSPELSVSVPSLAFDAGGGERSFYVTSNTQWNASCTGFADWCTVMPMSGSGDQTVRVGVTKNNSPVSRNTTVAITTSDGTLSRTVTVQQSSSSSELEVSQPNLDFRSEDDYKTLFVFSNTHWEASCESNGDWCSVAEPAFGNGDGMVRVNVAANDATTSRMATLTITDGTLTRTVKISQPAAFNVTPTSLSFLVNGGVGVVYISSDRNWSVTRNCTAGGVTWCSVTPTSGSGTQMLAVTVPATNAFYGSRNGDLTITCGTFSIQVNLSQVAPPT